MDHQQGRDTQVTAKTNPTWEEIIAAAEGDSVLAHLDSEKDTATIPSVSEVFEPAEGTPKVAKQPHIELVNVKKTYQMGERKLEALAGVSFTVDQGKFVIIAGASGSGKSTILNILGGMDALTSGRMVVNGVDLGSFTAKDMVDYRRNDVGYVFQFYNLIPNLTVLENVEMAAQIVSKPLDVNDVIASVGLSDRKSHFPSQLSGGEQQRVAIARALAKNPKLLLCDEPTGALDYETSRSIMKLLQDTCRERKITVVIVTHNLALIPMGDKVIKVKSGLVDSIIENDNPVGIEQIEW